MSEHKESDDGLDKSIQLNSSELLKDLDGNRRSFLKKLLISAAYVTPAILSFSIRDSEARARKLPTRKNKKRKRKKKKRKNK